MPKAHHLAETRSKQACKAIQVSGGLDDVAGPAGSRGPSPSRCGSRRAHSAKFVELLRAAGEMWKLVT